MRRILAALDVSKRTDAVFRTAIDFAKQYHAELLLFRAVDVPQEFPPAAATHHADALRPKLLEDARAELDGLAATARSAGIVTTTEVVVSSEPWRRIIDAAEARGVDVIIVGSHGYHVIDRLLGTTTARVADRAKCMVVVVHEPPATTSESASPYRSKP